MIIILRAIYMIIGWSVMLPITPLFCIGAYILYKREMPWMTGMDVWRIIEKQLITGIKQNIDFILYGLEEKQEGIR